MKTDKSCNRNSIIIVDVSFRIPQSSTEAMSVLIFKEYRLSLATRLREYAEVIR